MQTQEKVALHLFPGENCTLTPLPGVARVVHSKAFCTVHWQEGGRCKQGTKDTHLLPPAQILGIQSGQGIARGQVKCQRGSADSKSGGRPLPAADASQSSGESSPESAPGEGAAPSMSSPDAPDRPPHGHQDSGPSLEKTPVAALAVGGDSPIQESGTLPCSCGQPPDLVDELSLLDPLPRYLKSCQDLIIPDQCRCADTQSGREHPPLDRVASPEALIPCSSEVADSGPPGLDPHPGTDPQPDPRPLPDICNKEPAETPPEESQEKGSSSEPLLSQGQPAARPSKEVPASQLAQQLREEGWSMQTSESLTLAEVYLMMGKPSKLQLEYDWLAVLGPESQTPTAQGQTALSRSSPSALHQQRLLSCLLRLISTEVHPKMVSGVGHQVIWGQPVFVCQAWLFRTPEVTSLPSCRCYPPCQH